MCSELIFEGAPYENTDTGFCCGDCAFINNLISEKEYIKNYLFWIGLDGLRATVFNGKIYVSAYNHPFEFELKTQDYRKTKEYKEWRANVFERDGFKCQICGQVGGVLNAHHIKEFSKYPDLRYEVNNGITLCEDCHKNLHRKKVKYWQADKTR
jgi:hypothetical protein